MSLDEIAKLQQLLGEVLVAADPAAFWREHLSEHALDEPGLRIATLLVAKLRFQRLMNASALANEWFERDAEGFTEAFRRYHRTVTARSLDPWREAAAFEQWHRGETG